MKSLVNLVLGLSIFCMTDFNFSSKGVIGEMNIGINKKDTYFAVFGGGRRETDVYTNMDKGEVSIGHSGSSNEINEIQGLLIGYKRVNLKISKENYDFTENGIGEKWTETRVGIGGYISLQKYDSGEVILNFNGDLTGNNKRYSIGVGFKLK
jgi:hypothetical protein